MGDIAWGATFTVSKYCCCCTPAMIRSGQVRPYAVEIDESNHPTFSGLSAMWEAFIGGDPGDPFDNANTYIAVGNDARATDQTMTDLMGTSVRRPMEVSYPQHTDGTAVESDTINFLALFEDGAAEFSWYEVGIANAASGGLLLNRRPTNYGVKPAGQVWTMGIVLRFYGTESGTVQPPNGSPGGELPGTCFCTPNPNGPGGGGGPFGQDEIAQYTFATGDMTPHVVGQHVVRMPGQLTLVDVLSIPSSAVEWIVRFKGSTTIATASAGGGDIQTTSVNGVDVVSGDILEFELTEPDVAATTTISVTIESRTDRNRQLVWADRNTAGDLVTGRKGQHVFRSAGTIHQVDVTSLEAGDIEWEVFRDGASVGTFGHIGSEYSNTGSLNIPVAKGEIWEFRINSVSGVSGSTISLLVERT